ncbi:hypothetical protein ACHAWF_015940 [Thalassiosira exigua]
MLSPAFFAGVSGTLIPLPWRDGGVQRLRHSTITSSASSATGAEGASPAMEPTTSNRVSRRHSSFSANAEGGKDWPQSSGRGGEAVVTYGAEDDYAMSNDEFLTYQETFLRHCVTEAIGSSQPERHVYVDEAVGLFERSGLERDVLGRLWDVVVRDPDSGKLDEEEFVLMTHLIVCVSRRGLRVPEELPAPLHDWRSNRLSSKNSGGQDHLRGVHQTRLGQSQEGSESYARRGDEGALEPISVTPSQNSSPAREHRSNGSIDEQRMTQMELEIRSLMDQVKSLSRDVHELKVIVRGYGRLDDDNSRGAPNGVLGRPTDLPSKDDAPNVGVEMYWGDKELEEEEEEESDGAIEYHEYLMATPKTQHAPSAGPSQGRRPGRSFTSTLKSSLKSTSSGASSVRSRLISRNIPQIHRSNATRQTQAMQPKMFSERSTNEMAKSTNGSRDNLTSMRQSSLPHSNIPSASSGMAKSMNGVKENFGLRQSMPHSRVGYSGTEKSFNGPTNNLASMRQSLPYSKTHKSMNGAKGNRLGMRQSMPHSHAHAGYSGMAESANGVNSAASRSSRKMTKPIIDPQSNLATQMKQVQREADFDILLRKTRDTLQSDSGSVAGSNASSRPSRQGVFQPAQLDRASIARRRVPSRRASLKKQGLVESSRHIRRRASGEAEIYHEVEPPSTAAVDLPPL